MAKTDYTGYAVLFLLLSSLAIIAGAIGYKIIIDPFYTSEEERKEIEEKEFEERKKQASFRRRENIKREFFNKLISNLEVNPCNSPLYFFKTPIAGWQVTCEYCLAYPAEKYFSKDILELVDRYSINGKITLRQLLSLTGECNQ